MYILTYLVQDNEHYSENSQKLEWKPQTTLLFVGVSVNRKERGRETDTLHSKFTNHTSLVPRLVLSLVPG